MVPKKGKRCSSRNEEKEDPESCKAQRVYSPATQRRITEASMRESLEEAELLKSVIVNGKKNSKVNSTNNNNNNNTGKSIHGNPKEHKDGSDDSDWEDCTDDDDDVDERFDEMDDGEIIDDDSDEGDFQDDKDNETAIQEVLNKEFGNKVKSISFANDDGDIGDDEDTDRIPTTKKMVWRTDKANNKATPLTTTTTTGTTSEEGEDDSAVTTANNNNNNNNNKRSSSGDINDGLEYSNKAYDSFFQLRTEYPCLSFDVIHDDEGSSRTKYPLSMYIVCGTQADEKSRNQLLILKITNICKTKYDEESDDDDDDEDDLIGDGDSDESENDQDEAVNGHNGEPLVENRIIRHHGTANRVRCSRITNPTAPAKKHTAVWSDMGHVQIFNIENDFAALSNFSNWSKEQAKAWDKKKPQSLLFCSPTSSHTVEGYGLDWSCVRADILASGDCAGNLFIWAPQEGASWTATGSSMTSSTAQGHSSSSSSSSRTMGSIEEITWSPTEESVLCCGRAGGIVEVWDVRDMRKSQLSWQADRTDINVADWNRVKQASHLLVTGADSGAVSIWDLRKVMTAKPTPIQELHWHTGPITSVEFSKYNESVLLVTGDDGQCTLWDLSLERDPDEERAVIGELFGREDLADLPDQLMFQHQGLVHAKEGHFHSQIPGMVVTTDYYGLHIFKPMNWKSLMK